MGAARSALAATRRRTIVWVAVLALFIPAAGANAGAGDLDTSFGENGQARLGGAGGLDLALQAGKLLVTHGSGVARILATGIEDGSFHESSHPLQDCEARGLGIQKSLKIIVGGCTDTPLEADFAVTRHAKDGFVDPTFGDGGIVATDFGPNDTAPGPDDFVRDLIVQPDDKIVAVGISVLQNDESTYRTNWALARYTPNGALDATFGTGGKVVSGFAAGFCGVPFEAALQPDGKIVVVGSRCSSGDVNVGDVIIRRFHPSGALDATFGTGGTRLVDLGAYDEARSIALQPDGKIVVAARSTPKFYVTGGDFIVLRLDVAGSQDTAFGNGGVATIVTDVDDIPTDVALQPDGKIVVVGRGTQQSSYSPDGYVRIVLERFTSDGQADSTFGTGGRSQTWLTGPGPIPAVADTFAEAMLLLSDGRILVSGWMFEYKGFDDPPDYYTFVARFAAGAGGPACTIFGSDASEEIKGTPNADVICAGAGDDIIQAGGGNDIVFGGVGNDTILGGAGDDKLYGDAGNDQIVGGNGRDLLEGGTGADTLDARDSAPGDSVNGGAGTDVCLVDVGDTKSSCP